MPLERLGIPLYLICWISHHKLHSSAEQSCSSAQGHSTVSVDVPEEEEELGEGDKEEGDDVDGVGDEVDGDISLGEDEVELPDEGEVEDGELSEGDEEGERPDGLGDMFEVVELVIKF